MAKEKAKRQKKSAPKTQGSRKPKSTPKNKGSRKSSPVAQFFISYSRGSQDDKALARWLHEQLSESGHTVFLDERMRLGTKCKDEIPRTIEETDVFVVLAGLDVTPDVAFRLRVRTQMPVVWEVGDARLFSVPVWRLILA